MAAELLTTRQVADALGTDEWRVRRLFEDRTLPEPPKFGGKRVISKRQLPRIAAAMRSRGWLTDSAPAPITGGRAG